VRLPIASIFIDEAIYPRKEQDAKRIERYAALMRDGIEFPPVEVEPENEEGRHRLLDGAHRLGACKSTGNPEVIATEIDLNGQDALLYSASRNKGPKELTENECKEVARRAYVANKDLTSGEIGLAIGRSRQAVDEYIKDLRAAAELVKDLAILRMDRLGLPQARGAVRVELSQAQLNEHLSGMPDLAFPINAGLARGFTAAQVAEQQGWPEPLVWSLALEGKADHPRFESLQWGLRTWDTWGWGDVDHRFGDDWPGRIPAQLVGHALYYFSKPGDLVFDPMAGGGVVPDTCLALGRHCWAFDLVDRPETRPEIEPHVWTPADLAWPVNGKSKPDLIFFDPPYFDKKADEYAEGSISALPRTTYLKFFAEFFRLAKDHTKKSTRLAFLNADWRDFQGKPALEEDPAEAITILDYGRVIEGAGWQVTHLIDAPMSSERFHGGVVAAMQTRRTLGVVRRTLIMARRRD
jgi:hypothetical protein